MVSRDLICDEAMPPVDDGDNMLDMRNQTIASTSFVRQQQLNNQYNNYLNNVTTSSDTSLSKSSMVINAQEISRQSNFVDHNTTVRDVITRQFKNNKLKTNSHHGFPKIEVTIAPFDGKNNILTQQSHQISFNNNNDALSNQNSSFPNGNGNHLIIENSSVFTELPEHVIVNNSASKVVLHNSRMNTTSKQKYRNSSNTNNFQHRQTKQQQITTFQWAEYPIVDNQKSNLEDQQQTTGNMIFTKACLPSSSYAIVTPFTEDDESTANDVSTVADTIIPLTSISGQQNQTHSSPRPSILRGHNTLRRLTDRERPASASGISDDYGNGTSRLFNCSSRDNGEFSNAFDETPKKRARKQHFENIALQQDKLMMEVTTTDIHLQQSSVDQPVRIEASAYERQTSVVANSLPILHNTDGNTLNLAPKKRGRPKMKNQAQISVSLQNLKGDNISTHNDLTNFSATAKNMSDINKKNGAFVPDQKPEQSRLMIGVDSILQSNNVSNRRRRYTKRTPKIDSLTGELVKKLRKKGSGRKSKREMELAAQQQREYAILAEMGMGYSTNAQLQEFDCNTNYQNQTNQQQHRIYTSVQNSTNESQIEEKEHEVINALCRFRRDSEKQQRKQKAEISKKIMEKATEKKIHQRTITALLHANTTNNEEKTKQHSHSHMEKQKRNNNFTESISMKHLHCALPLIESNNFKTSLGLLFNQFGTELRKHIEDDNLIGIYEKISSFCNSNFDQMEPSTSNVTTLFCTEQIPYKKILSTFNNDHSMGQISERICCPIFGTYERFKRAVDSLQMFPFACNYFLASQRLLHFMRTYIVSNSIYNGFYAKSNNKLSQMINRKLNDSEANKLIPLSSLDLNTNEKVENLAHDFFLSNQLRDNAFFHCDDINPCTLLLHFDVAQTLDSVLNCVTRNILQENKEKQFTMNNNFIISNNKNNQQQQWRQYCIYSNSKNRCRSIFTKNVIDRVPKPFMKMLYNNNKDVSKRRRRRQRKVLSNDDESGDSDTQQKCGVEIKIDNHCLTISDVDKNYTKNRILSGRKLLDQINSLYKQANNDLTILDGLFTRVNFITDEHLAKDTTKQNMTSPVQLMELFKQEGQRKKSIHKSNQFMFRPPLKLLQGIFKNVVDFEQAIDDSRKMEENRRTKDAEMANDDNMQQHQSKLVADEIDQLLIDSEHSSARAKAQLQCNYTMQHYFTKQRTGIICEFDQFQPALKHVIPINGTHKSKNEYVKSQVRELREIYQSTLNLIQNRVYIAEECANCLQQLIVNIDDTNMEQQTGEKCITTQIERIYSKPDKSGATTSAPTAEMRES